jgi:deoxyribodipyrimidine photo-lyase
MKAFWFRRDLRLKDNHGLFRALSENEEILPIFIFDEAILKHLPKQDRRLDFIHRRLSELDHYLRSKSYGGLLVLHGDVQTCWEQVIKDYSIDELFCNRDYEPQAIDRDFRVEEQLREQGIKFTSFKDQVIFEDADILKADGTPYTVYTPYKKQWLNHFSQEMGDAYPSEKFLKNLTEKYLPEIISLESLGFETSDLIEPPQTLVKANIKSYEQTRDFPALNTTSRLSVALRFGTRSVRSLVREARELNETWLSELIWREFFMMILCHFPESVDRVFKEKYDNISWRNDPDEFKAWCDGKTGYELVDAGMRELNETGFMHNRVRMVVASFLVKHLLIDWRWGERYFAEKLLDYDLSANVGNWQWAAGTGCDAAPYFRVFNPMTQAEKFDKQREYIKTWIPEVDTLMYPQAIVEHKFARERALSTYKKALSYHD